MKACFYGPTIGRSVALIACSASLLACTAELSGPDGGTPGGGGSPTGVGGTTGGTSGSSGSGGANPGPPPAYEPPPAVLRRLTRAQFATALEDVFGTQVDRSRLDSDNYTGNFAVIGAASVVTSELGAERYLAAIETAVDAVFSDDEKRSVFVGCEPAAADDECVRGYLTRLGRQAWRRDLTQEEVDELVVVAQTASTEFESLSEGTRWATVALFSSLHFLYRAELGTQTASAGLRISGYEMASRLAFLLWNSLPDAELLDDAASGGLDSPAEVLAAAERMLAAPQGKRSVGAFAEDYMRLDRVLTQAKDASLFPEYDPTLQAAMVRDMRETWELVAFQDNASALDLFSTRKAIVNAGLAQLYGLDAAGLSTDTFEVAELPADDPRVGILGKMAFLSQFANQKEGSPTLRGKFMREVILCTHIDPPPGNVALELPEPLPDQPMTKRERLEKHRTEASCAVCHALTDPMGLPFENFDAIGRFRTTDHGLDIDASGEFEGTEVANSKELGLVMSTSPVVAECLARKVYTYALGHEERDVDATVVSALQSSFAASDYRLKQLLLDIVTSDAFAAVAPTSD